MNKSMSYLIIVLLMLSMNVSARSNEAQKARANNLQAVTTFVDINGLTRKNNAAKKMTKLHQMYAKEGYELLSINVYTENGDLEGFFVSYITKKHKNR